MFPLASSASPSPRSIGNPISTSSTQHDMNCAVCHLKDLELEHYGIREVIRALRLIQPKEIDLELFEITYVQCGDIEVEKKVDEKIEQFIGWVEKHPNKEKPEIALEERSTCRVSPEASLREVLFQIIRFVNDKKDSVPPVPNREEVISFPYEITITSSSDSAFGMEMIQRMLQTGHLTMLI